MIIVHTQLRLARPLTSDLWRPWEKSLEPERLTPARVRRGFRNLRTKTLSLAGAPKPSRPGPGRPPGSKTRNPHNTTTSDASWLPARHTNGQPNTRKAPTTANG